jgi:hypothetical protein
LQYRVEPGLHFRLFILLFPNSGKKIQPAVAGQKVIHTKNQSKNSPLLHTTLPKIPIARSLCIIHGPVCEASNRFSASGLL